MQARNFWLVRAGVTKINKSFSFGYAFISHYCFSQFTWALTSHSLLVFSAIRTFVSLLLNEDELSVSPVSSLKEPQPELNLNVPPLPVINDSPPLLLRLGSRLSLRSGWEWGLFHHHENSWGFPAFYGVPEPNCTEKANRSCKNA